MTLLKLYNMLMTSELLDKTFIDSHQIYYRNWLTNFYNIYCFRNVDTKENIYFYAWMSKGNDAFKAFAKYSYHESDKNLLIAVFWACLAVRNSGNTLWRFISICMRTVFCSLLISPHWREVIIKHIQVSLDLIN